jgi:hypothetical protein
MKTQSFIPLHHFGLQLSNSETQMFIEFSEQQITEVLIASRAHLASIEQELYRLSTIRPRPDRICELEQKRDIVMKTIRQLWRGRI